MAILIHRNIKGEGEIGLWKIEEEESFFADKLKLAYSEQQQIDLMKGHRRVEWYASRYLLHVMSGREKRGVCLKDEFGKPFLLDSLFDISISHSRELAAVIAAPCSVGIDIQRIVEKIERIAHKYMREEEMASLKEETRINHLHVYWGAKECLYKAYGQKKLDFKEHIFINPFEYDVTNGTCSGYVTKGERTFHFKLYYELIEEDYILVYALEDNGDQRIA